MVSIGWVADGEAAIPSVVEVLPRPDGGASGSRIVLVPVGARDRRAVLAARYAALIPAAERRAVHVAVDPRVGEELYLEWIYDPPAALPLDIVPDIGGIACSVVSMVNECRETGASDVVVLLGQLTMRALRRRLLHDSTAIAISAAVQELPGTTAVLLAVGRRA